MPILPPQTSLSLSTGLNLDTFVVVSSPQELQNTDPNKVYVLDGVIDFSSSNLSIEVPQGGLSILGFGLDQFKLTCSDDNYSLFTSPSEGSGNLFLSNLSIEVTGTNSQVYELTSDTGFEAVELSIVNYNNCTSLGEITSYRQVLESGTGRFGGTPELTLSGNFNGYRVSTSIVRNLNNITSLFKEGTSLQLSGRFISDMNCDLPPSGSLLDFSESNILNKESLALQGAFITRSGVIDSQDPDITPNISQTSLKSLWKGNTGIPNTTKYIRSTIVTEATTVVSAIDTYYPLQGVWTVEANSHISMPANGEFEILSGTGTYEFSGDLSIEGGANQEVDVRVVKSTDGGSTYPQEIFHSKRLVNNLLGFRDVAFFNLTFVETLSEGERVRLEVENKSGVTNLTVELGSSFIIKSV